MAAARSQELGQGVLCVELNKAVPIQFPCWTVCVCVRANNTPHIYPSQILQICIIRLSLNKMASWAESQHRFARWAYGCLELVMNSNVSKSQNVPDVDSGTMWISAVMVQTVQYN